MQLSKPLYATLLVALCIATSVLFAGCATIIRGAHQDLQITSDPSGATVTIQGQERGTTPLTLGLDRDQTYRMEFSKDGYSSETLLVSSEFTIGAPVVGNIFSWGLLGLVVDIAGGAAYKLSPEQVQAVLDESSSSASVDVPEGSDMHVVLFSKEDVEGTVDLSKAQPVEFDVVEGDE